MLSFGLCWQAGSLTKLNSATGPGVPTLPAGLTLLDISGTTQFNSYTIPSGLVKLYAAGSGLTGALPNPPASLTYLDVSDTGITAGSTLNLGSTLVTLDVSGSAITGTLPALPATLTNLDVSDTGITAFADITTTNNPGLKTLLAGGAPLPAVPSPLPAATLEYVYGWQPACACAVVQLL